MDLSVIVPCFNEEDNLGILVDRIQGVFNDIGTQGEIVLVDDGSTDRTSQVITGLQSRYKNVLSVSHGSNLGIARAWATGLKRCSGRYIVTIDADMQYQPEDIAKLYQTALKTDADLVQGYRRFNVRNLRYILSSLFSILLNILFFNALKDPKSGFVVYKKEILQDLLKYKKTYVSYQSLIIVSARARHYKIRQIPVGFSQRYSGTTSQGLPARLSKIPKFFRDIWRWYLEFCF